MSDDVTDPAAPVVYKGRQIVLTTTQQSDETWTCRYSILELGQGRVNPSEGHAEGTFPSREAAQLAALEKAKAAIDLR